VLTIARAFVRSDATIQSDEGIQAVGLRAYEAADQAAFELAEIRAAGVEVDVQEGSLSIAAAIVTTAAALYVGITAYDSFWSGVERIRQHGVAVGSLLRARFRTDPIVSRGAILSTRVTTGHLDKLHRLRRDVEAGVLTTDAAVQEVLKTLRTAGETIDDTVLLQVEDAFGAPHRGRDRLERLAERHFGDRASPRGYGATGSGNLEAEPKRPVRRRLTISRPPGSAEPVTRFDRGSAQDN
jgi:hypothetical protein